MEHRTEHTRIASMVPLNHSADGRTVCLQGERWFHKCSNIEIQMDDNLIAHALRQQNRDNRSRLPN